MLLCLFVSKWNCIVWPSLIIIIWEITGLFPIIQKIYINLVDYVMKYMYDNEVNLLETDHIEVLTTFMYVQILLLNYYKR